MPYIQNNSKDIKTPLARARHHGSAQSGTHHWWMQRVTAIALVPLTIWMLSCASCFTMKSQLELITWLKSPFIAIVMSLFVITSFYHAALGMQTIIEDYVHKKGTKIFLLLLVQYGLFVMGAVCLYAILKINFGIDL